MPQPRPSRLPGTGTSWRHIMGKVAPGPTGGGFARLGENALARSRRCARRMPYGAPQGTGAILQVHRLRAGNDRRLHRPANVPKQGSDRPMHLGVAVWGRCLGSLLPAVAFAERSNEPMFGPGPGLRLRPSYDGAPWRTGGVRPRRGLIWLSVVFALDPGCARAGRSHGARARPLPRWGAGLSPG